MDFNYEAAGLDSFGFGRTSRRSPRTGGMRLVANLSGQLKCCWL